MQFFFYLFRCWDNSVCYDVHRFLRQTFMHNELTLEVRYLYLFHLSYGTAINHLVDCMCPVHVVLGKETSTSSWWTVFVVFHMLYFGLGFTSGEVGYISLESLSCEFNITWFIYCSNCVFFSQCMYRIVGLKQYQ